MLQREKSCRKMLIKPYFGRKNPGLLHFYPFAGYGAHSLDGMGVSPLAMMGMHEQYPWMKEKKSSRKNQMTGKDTMKSYSAGSDLFLKNVEISQIFPTRDLKHQ